MKKISLIIYIFFTVAFLYAQVGINTENPQATLDIHATSATQDLLKINNENNNNLFFISKNGYVGINNTNPKVKLDFRNSITGEGTIGIGNTSMTAIDAKEGALRYNSSLSKLEYSDGSRWVALQKTLEQTYVTAQYTNPSGSFLTIGTDANGWATNTITSWSKIRDNTSSFNAASGVFTAQRSGIFSISCTLLLDQVSPSSIEQDASAELNLVTNSSVAPREIKSVTSVGLLKSSDTFKIPLINKCFVYLNKGDTFYFYIFIKAVDSAKITTDGSYNILTISEM